MRRIVLLAFDGVQSLDVTGPLEVFQVANRLAEQAGTAAPYRTEVVGPRPGAVRTSSGLAIVPDRAASACRGAIDTLVVAGGQGTVDAVRDPALVAWVRAAARRSRRVTSVCTGAFLLGEAGLLDGRAATTHWASCDALRRRFPAASVDAAPIYVRDGELWTSAGVTAGMDLALALVEDDLGPAMARDVARWLVLFVRRPGGQAQFSAQLAAQVPGRAALRELLGWIAEHLDGDCSVAALAGRAAMSPRHFAREFRAATGMTPGAYVEAARVEAARRLLETTELTTAEVARRCGLRSVETLHRVCRKALGVTPGQYRRHFGPKASA